MASFNDSSGSSKSNKELPSSNDQKGLTALTFHQKNVPRVANLHLGDDEYTEPLSVVSLLSHL